MSDGTDNHLLLLDVWGSKKISGKEAEVALDNAYISTNKNMISIGPKEKDDMPTDSNGKKVGTPFNPRGIRLGTPALTTRGFVEEDMKVVGEQIVYVLENPTDTEGAKKVILELCEKYPLYPGLGILQ